MSVINSTMPKLGMIAKSFKLPSASGDEVSLDDYKGSKAYLIMFLSNHCPYVQHVKSELVRIANNYIPRGVAVIGINSNDWDEYPDDKPEYMKKEGYPFPYLYDRFQDAAKSYTAACTPDIFLYNEKRELVYRGQIDGSRPGNNVPLTGHDLRNALDALLQNKPINEDQKPSSGCSIKWRSGNKPDYVI